MKKKNIQYNQYAYESGKGGHLGVAVFVLSALLIISVCNVFSYVFFSSGVDFVSGKQHNENNFYAIEVECFDDYDKAQEYAEDLQKKGGAGYITYNKQYKVLTSLYLTQNQAKAVLDNLKTDYPNAKLYELVLPDISTPSELNDNQTKAITTSLAVAKSTIATMYNIYIGLDKGEIKDNSAKSMLFSLYDDCSSQVDNFKVAFHSQDKAVYVKYKMYLNDFTANIADVANLDLSGMELSQIVKYQQIKCAFLYITMSNLFV